MGDLFRREKEGVPPLGPGNLQDFPIVHRHAVLFPIMGTPFQKVKKLRPRAIGIKSGSVGKEEGQRSETGPMMHFVNNAFQRLIGSFVGRRGKKPSLLQARKEKGKKEFTVGLS